MKWFSLQNTISLLLLSYCIYSCRDLITAWRDAPYERGGWLILALWILPLLFQRSLNPQSGILIMGAIGVALGNLLELNVLCHIGLTVALISLTPKDARAYRFLLLTACWIPIYGWFMVHMGLSPLTGWIIRIILTAAISSLLTAQIFGKQLFPSNRKVSR